MAILVELAPVSDRTQLAHDWRELEGRARPSFFNSWTWIGTWLDELPPKLETALLKATVDGRLAGMAIVVRSKSRLLKGISVNCWRVHATGLPELDDLYIEYNGFLLDETHAAEAAQAMLKHLLHLSGSPQVDLPRVNAAFGEVVKRLGNSWLVRQQSHTSRLVDLAEVRAREGQLLPILSSNARSQIRRSIKEYEKLGPLTIHQAETLAEARAYLGALRALHDHSWHDKGRRSSFTTHGTTQRFHDKLVATGFQRGEVQLLRVAAGPRVLGYLYNFCHQGRVSYYQSGFQYHVLAQHDRPGLVSHLLAIEHNARQGALIYDFMSGDYRYKSTLAHMCEEQTSFVINQNGVLQHLDATLRRWRDQARQHHLSPAHAVRSGTLSMTVGMLPVLEDLILTL